MTMQPNNEVPESPPSYDTATQEVDKKPSVNAPATDKPNSQTLALPVDQPGTSQPYVQAGPMVYHYMNPSSQHHFTSFLPPDHPEMICLQEGQHDTETRFGLLGMLAAVLWFPFGVGLCLLDRRVKCRRCGMIIDDGLSC